MGKPWNHSPSSNTAAVITIPAVPDIAHELEQVDFSYSGIPDAGSYIQVESPSGTVLKKLYVTAAGAGPLPLGNSGMKCAVGGAVIITLAAGGSGISGSVNAIQRT